MLAKIITDYQRYNPVTGQFDADRNSREYADLLGINYVYLRQIMTGARQPGTETLGKLMRAFPDRRSAIAEAMATAMTTPTAVAV